MTADRYFVNFYGEDAASFLHRNGTDRLWVEWDLTRDRPAESLEEDFAVSAASEATKLIELGKDDEPVRNEADIGLARERLEVEIPSNISTLERQNPDLAVRWRAATRDAFTRALAAGFVVDGFSRAEGPDRRSGSYSLRRFEKEPTT